MLCCNAAKESAGFFYVREANYYTATSQGEIISNLDLPGSPGGQIRAIIFGLIFYIRVRD